MASNLGSLTVALGLDAADYTRGLNKAQKDAYDFGREIGEQIRSGVLIATGALTALGVAGAKAFDFVKTQASAIDAFNDLSDATGASIENVSALDRVARQTGATFGTAESVLLKFNTALKNAKPNTEAEAALKALNVNIAELKSLDPAEALRQTAVAFAGFENDANKARAMQVLFGKSVKEVAPFLNDLAEQSSLVGTANAAAAAQAETFNKQLAALKANSEDTARSIVTSLLPALNQFLKNYNDIKAQGGFGLIVKDAAKDFFGLSTNMTGDNGADINRLIKQRDDLQKAMAGETRPLVRANDSRKSEVDEINRYLGILRAKQKNAVDIANLGQDYGDAISRRFNQQAKLPEIVKPTKASGGGRDTSAQEAKSQLGLDLEKIRASLDGQVDAYRNAERLLAAERSAGLKSEDEYYNERVKLVQQTTAAQEAAARASITRLEKEKLTGKDAIDNAKKIEVEQAKLAKAQADGATTVSVLGIESEAAGKRITSAYLSAQQAAQDFFDTTNRGYARELAGAGQGQSKRDYTGGIQQIEERYQQQRQALQNARDLAELKGPLGAKEAKFFDDQLALNRQYQEKSLESYSTYYEARKKLESDWTVGASEALHNYADEAANVAKQVEDAFTSGFKGLEDALVDFVTTGKADFKSLADSIIKDIARIVVKQNITGPLAEGLAGLFNFGTPSTSTATGITQIMNMGNSNAGILQLLSGTRASGGPVQAGGLYQVNERGPELLDYDGKQLLMMGSKGGRVVANSQLGGGGGTVINQYNTVGDVATLSMVRQAQAGSERRAAAAMQRSQRYGGALAG